MKGLDVHFPISDFENLSKLKGFTIIQPLESYIAQNVTLQTIVRTIAWDDEVYVAMMTNQEIPPECLIVRGIGYYDISYLRDCSVRKVAKGEWKTNWGPQGVKDWIEYSRQDTIDRFVRILHLEKPTYSLKDFNAHYKKAQA